MVMMMVRRTMIIMILVVRVMMVMIPIMVMVVIWRWRRSCANGSALDTWTCGDKLHRVDVQGLKSTVQAKLCNSLLGSKHGTLPSALTIPHATHLPIHADLSAP